MWDEANSNFTLEPNELQLLHVKPNPEVSPEPNWTQSLTMSQTKS